MVTRRWVLGGLIAAPSIVKVSSLMPIHDPIINGLEFISGLGPHYDKQVWWTDKKDPTFKNYTLKYFSYCKTPKIIKPKRLSYYYEVIKEQTSPEIGYEKWREL